MVKQNHRIYIYLSSQELIDSYFLIKRAPKYSSPLLIEKFRKIVDAIIGELVKSGGTVRIRLTQGQYATVDARDFWKVEPYSWSVHNEGYAQAPVKIRDPKTGKMKGIKVLMHNIVKPAPPGLITDHRYHDKLDQTSWQLATVTPSENVKNRKPRDQ